MNLVDKGKSYLLRRVRLNPFTEIESSLLVTFHTGGISLEVIDDVSSETVGSERVGEEETVGHRVYTEDAEI